MIKKLKIVLIILPIVLVTVALFLKIRFGGGTQYKDLSTDPLYRPSDLELVYESPYPLGNVAVGKDQNEEQHLYFTVHPESNPNKMKVMELKDGEAIPFPSLAYQENYNTVLGIFCDQQNRLWTLDYGFHGLGGVELKAFDLNTKKLVHEYIFPDSIAKAFSHFNDLTVSGDGRMIAIANDSFIGKKPSLVIYDTHKKKSRNLFENHPALQDNGYVPTTVDGEMSVLFGLVDFQIGIDGIDFSRDGAFLYWGPMSGATLYAIPTKDLINDEISEEQLAIQIINKGPKTLNDGLRLDEAGNVYLCDVDHQGIYVVQPSGERFTLIKDSRIQWPDGLALGTDGYMYLCDSDLQHQVLRSKSHMEGRVPYEIFRFKVLP